MRRVATTQARPRQSQVTRLADHGQTHQSGLHGMALIIQDRRPKYRTSRFCIGDLVRLKDPKNWPKTAVPIYPNMSREGRYITQIAPLFDKWFVVSFDDSKPVFDERLFELAAAKVIDFPQAR